MRQRLLIYTINVASFKRIWTWNLHPYVYSFNEYVFIQCNAKIFFHHFQLEMWQWTRLRQWSHRNFGPLRRRPSQMPRKRYMFRQSISLSGKKELQSSPSIIYYITWNSTCRMVSHAYTCRHTAIIGLIAQITRMRVTNASRRRPVTKCHAPINVPSPGKVPNVTVLKA